MHARRDWSLLLLLPLLAWGCSGRKFVPPAINAKEAAERAFGEYDKNHDGVLDADELERCPGLKKALKTFDRNGDGRLSREELEEGLATYEKTDIGLMEVVCAVTLDGAPLAGADVVLEPEPFLGPNFKPARGTTDQRGRARMQIDGAAKPGANLGIYRVRIAKAGGQPALPARYNTQTQLGVEIGPDASGPIVFRLTAGN